MKNAGTLGRLVAFATIGVGLLVIGLGYNGIAGQSLDARAQLPYLLSGGFLGLAIVVFGTGLLVNHSAREDRARMEGVLQQLLEAQAAAPGARSVVRTAAGAGPSTGAGDGPDGAVVPSTADGLFAAGTASFHTPTCRLVKGRDETTYVTAEEAAAQSLRPCRVCLPNGLPIGVPA